MKAWAASLRLAFELVVAPRAALGTILGRAPWGAMLLLLGALQAALVLLQSRTLEPVLLADPLFADAPQAVTRFWWARVVAAAGAPLGMALRAAAFATLVHGVLALGGGNVVWRSLWSLALHLELVFSIEVLATTVVLALAPPANLAALAATPLRAGLDLVWEPASAQGRSLLAAANAFTVWWALLVAIALAMLVGRRRGVPIAVALWIGLVGVRCALRAA